MDSQRDSRAAGKHAAIVKAATAVFLAKGYDGTSMDDVATMAEVSKPTVYKYFADKERLFAEIIMATTDQIEGTVRLVTETFARTGDLPKQLRVLARGFLAALMQPDLLRLRRLVIANADRFPHIGRSWYEDGFERVLKTLAASFQRLAADGALQLDDPLLAANHFVGLLLWIPVNKAMFTGNHDASTPAELNRNADAAVRVFLASYGDARSSTAPTPVRRTRSSTPE